MRREYIGKLVIADYWGTAKLELHIDGGIILAESIFDDFVDRKVKVIIDDDLLSDSAILRMTSIEDD